MSVCRLAVGGFLAECNHLGGIPIDLECFRRYELCRGQDMLGIDTGVVGGMLDVLRRREADVAPLVYASACAGGPVTGECYRHLRDDLLARLRNAMPVDAVLMPLHGAATVEGLGDPEGDLIRRVREIVGFGVPIVATLDLHAHVTADMVRFADALLAWATYPHHDQFDTGQRAARLLVDTFAGRCRPTMAMAKVPVITSAIHGSTEGDDPFAEIMRGAKALERHDAVLSTSVFLVQPYLDLPNMGSGGLVITDDDPDQAVVLAREIALAYWEKRFELEPVTYTPAEAIAKGLAVDGGPVILVETADCCGGGAAGDSVATLAALLDARIDMPALVPVVDPDAAAGCHQAGTGRDVTLDLGHRLDPRWGEPLVVNGRVARLGDGRFTYSGGMWDGLDANMGPCAVVRIGSAQVLVTTYATYDWADEQFRSMGLRPDRAKFVVAKNPMNYRLAYGAIAKAVFVLDTPGPTPATLRHVTFHKLGRPYFPADTDIPGLTPTVLQ